MYDKHVPIISAAMRSDPDVFARGVMFAVLSARTQFITVPAQLKELERDGARARCLWAWKHDAYAYVTENKVALWRDVKAAATAEEGLRVLTRVPGLGIVKSAFVLQMMGFDVACLDVRNIERDGRDPNAYRSRKDRPAVMARNIARYVDDVGGRAREYWDAWCADVARTYRLTPEECSAIHLNVVPEDKRRCSGVKDFAPVAAQSEIPF